MRVIVLPSTYPRDQNDPRGVFYRDHAIALQRAGAEVTVIAPIMHALNRLPCSPMKFINRDSDENGIRTIIHEFVGCFPKLPYLTCLQWAKAAERMLYLFVERHGAPDFVHAHCAVNAGYAAYRFSRKSGIPYLITEHSTGYRRGIYNKSQINISKKVFNSANARIAVSKQQAVLMADQFSGQGEWVAVPNALSAEFHDHEPVHGREPGMPFTFVSVGYLKPIKDHALLLKALRSVTRSREHVRLVIVGDGPEKMKLLSLAKQLGIQDKVTLTGILPRTQVRETLDSADSFVLPSQYETFGVVVIEALSRGLPVIATRCEGPNDIITPKNGLLVPIGEANLLAAAMIEIMEKFSDFDKQVIRRDACKKYGPESVGTALLNCAGNSAGIR